MNPAYDCRTIPSNPNACFHQLDGNPGFSPTQCDTVGGYLPRFTESGQYEELLAAYPQLQQIWSGLVPASGT